MIAEYGSTYDVEVGAGLVKKAESEKPYARDSGLNGANLEKVRESERQNPYSGPKGYRAQAPGMSHPILQRAKTSNSLFEVFYLLIPFKSFLFFPAQVTSLRFMSSLDGHNGET